MTFREVIENKIKNNRGNEKQAAIDICLFLNSENSLPKISWQDVDKELAKLMARR